MFSLPFFKKKPRTQMYFGVLLSDSQLTGFGFTSAMGRATLLATHTVQTTLVYDQVLQALDAVISEVESRSQFTVDKTIFFLHSFQLDESTHAIQEPYKSILGKASKELALEPLGYLDIRESLTEHQKEHSIVNYIFVELDHNSIGAAMYKGSMLQWQKRGERTSSAAEDLAHLFSTVPATMILPEKIFLYGSEDLQKIATECASYAWDEHQFPQHPALELFQETQLTQILANTCAKELSGDRSTETTIDHPSEGAQSVSSAVAVGSTGTLAFGFVLGGEVRGSSSEPIIDADMPVQQAPPVQNIQGEVSNPPQDDTSHPSESGVSLPRIHMPSFTGKKSLITVIATIFILAGIAVGFEYKLHTAKIEVQVTSSLLSDETDLTIPVSEDIKADLLSVMKHTKSTQVSDSVNTSGKRDVGQKAKGQIVLHNFDDSSKTFTKGTILKNGSLEFVLDNDVTVASSSGVTSDGVKQSGKAKASVTATTIGSEYNVKSATQFSVDSLPSSLYVAFADSAFTGGTKKQVSTVSKNDLELLKEKAIKEASASSSQDIHKIVSDDEVLLPDLTDIVLSDTTFSSEVGEEATDVKLKGSSDIVYYTVKKNIFERSLLGKLGKKKSADYTLKTASLSYTLHDITLSKDESEVAVTVKSQVTELKNIDMAKVKSALSHRTISGISQAVTQIEGVKGATLLENRPSVPVNVWTPLFPANITVIADSP